MSWDELRCQHPGNSSRGKLGGGTQSLSKLSLEHCTQIWCDLNVRWVLDGPRQHQFHGSVQANVS